MMRSARVPVAAVAILMAAATLAAGQSPGREAPGARGLEVSAPIGDVRYEVTFDPASALRRTLHVDMSFTTSSDAPVLLSLPAWTPGAYEISYFARDVLDFHATGNGAPLGWDKLDYDTWRVRPAGATTVTVSFDVLADTLDNAMSWTRPDFALFNGTNVFPYPEGRGFDFPARVHVRTDSTWLVATGMTPAGPRRTWAASNYHDLVDMPFFVGRFDFDSVRVAGHWLRIASYPGGSIPPDERARDFDDLGRILRAEAAVFDTIPFGDYTLMQIADSSYGGISGLEHQSSHVDVTTPLAIGQPILMSVYAHEIFHAWNVKRLRPADLWPYDYAREQPTPWLWVSEGITDYYADLAEVRSGVIDSTAFFQLTAGKMAEVANARPTGLEDASLSTWVHPEDGTADLYYPKGSLAGFMLDVIIRDASDGRRSLDDVMRTLYRETYEHGRGFTRDDWWQAVSAAAGGRSFADFDARYVDGRDPYPWSTILPLAALRLRVDTSRVPTFGVTTLPDSTGLRITAVAPGSSADEAGVRVGDYLLALASIPVSERGFVARFRARVGTRPGTPFTVDVRRDDQTITLDAKLHVDEHIAMQLEADPNAPAKPKRVLEGILHGR